MQMARSYKTQCEQYDDMCRRRGLTPLREEQPFHMGAEPEPEPELEPMEPEQPLFHGLSEPEPMELPSLKDQSQRLTAEDAERAGIVVSAPSEPEPEPGAERPKDPEDAWEFNEWASQ